LEQPQDFAHPLSKREPNVTNSSLPHSHLTMKRRFLPTGAETF
jgi:hypothetical protein